MPKKTTKPEIYKTLVLSTAHLPRYLAHLANLETKYSFDLTKLEPVRYGLSLWVGWAEDPKECKTPECLIPILKYAKKKKCRYVNFDQDGEIMKDFCAYEW